MMLLENEADKKHIFEDMKISLAVRTMAVPMIISQLIVLVYNLADTFFIGRANNPYMVAAISMILPVFNISLSLAGLTGIGGGTLMSRLLGVNDPKEARKVCVFSIYFAFIIAGVFVVVMAIFADPILIMVGASENTLAYARQYTYLVIVIGCIPTVLSNVLSNLVRSIGYSSKASFGIGMGGAINIVLDPLFMFVILPSGYEVVGVGIATCLSNTIAFIYFVVTMFTLKDEALSMNIKEGLPSGKSIKSIFAVGIPSSITTLLFDLDYAVLDRLMVTYGDIPLAAIGIVIKAERFPLNVGIGLCQGVVPLIAYNFSSKNYERMQDIITYMRRTGLIVGVISVVLYEIFAVYLMRFFISDAATVALGTDFLRARILATPLMFLSFSMVNIFNGFGEGGIALFLGVTRWLLVNIPMLFIMNALFGIYGLVWSQLAGDSIVALISQFVYRRYRKKLVIE